MPRKKTTTGAGADHAQDKPKRGPGQPRKIKDAEHLARVVEEYINYNISCNQDDNIKLPTDYDFCNFAGIGISTYYQYQEDKETYKGYTEALKKTDGIPGKLLFGTVDQESESLRRSDLPAQTEEERRL